MKTIKNQRSVFWKRSIEPDALGKMLGARPVMGTGQPRQSIIWPQPDQKNERIQSMAAYQADQMKNCGDLAPRLRGCVVHHPKTPYTQHPDHKNARTQDFPEERRHPNGTSGAAP